MTAPAALGRRRRRGGVAWSPRTLFANGEAGAVYDPSDLTAEKVAWRRNQLLRSEEFTNATAWSLTNATLTANQGIAPDGTNTVTRAVFSGGVGSYQRRVTQTPSVSTLPAGTRFTVSVWARGNVGGEGFVITDGWGAPTLVTLTTTLTRYSWTFTAQGTSNLFNLQSETDNATVFFWGAQFELGTVATAYQRITDFNSDFLAAFPTHALFQDSAGTTPVTALGQPVGLALDQSRGGLANLGPELVTIANSSLTAWNTSSIGTNTFALDGADGWKLTYGNTQNGPTLRLQSDSGSPIGGLSTNLTVGRWYRITFEAKVNTGNVVYGLLSRVGSFAATVTVSSTSFQTYSMMWLEVTGGNAQSNFYVYNSLDVGEITWIRNISVREVPGVHAIQPTSASRPTVQARVNLLTYSEQFDDLSWVKQSASVTANAAVAPDGTTTADQLTEDSTANSHRFNRQLIGATITGVNYTYSIALKANTRSAASVQFETTGSRWTALVDLSAGTIVTTRTNGSPVGNTASITALGDGWHRVTLTLTAGGTSPYIEVALSNSTTPTWTGDNQPTYTGNGTGSIFVWGADFRPTMDWTAFPQYQRVVTATDYADVGAPRRFLFDGVDDSLYTAANLDLSGTNRVTVIAGMQKLVTGASGLENTVVELGADVNTTVGTFALKARPNDWFPQIRTGGAGATSLTASSSSPSTNVVSAAFDGSTSVQADAIVARVNAQPLGTASGASAAGSFTSRVLNIGRTNNATLPFNGAIFQLIVRGAATDAASLAQAERYVAQRTGITL